MVSKTLLGFFLCLLGTTVIATTRSPRLGSPEFCNLQQLNVTQAAVRFEFEGGSIETWNRFAEQFQCLGVALTRMTIQPNSLSLPSYQPFPRLVFIEQGEGIIGVELPGCAETFDTGVHWPHQQPRTMAEQGGDSHQKVHRFQQGDIIAIPASAIHWTYNDRNQEVVAIFIDDLNNPANQLDLNRKIFHLAGGYSSQHIQGKVGKESLHREHEQSFNIESIISGFDTDLLAEAFNFDPQIVRAMQESGSGDRGLIVKVQQPMEFVTPDEQQEQTQQGRGSSSNGVEEKICSSKIFYNLDNQREADIFSRRAGKVNMVNKYKLPILSYLDLSAEKGHLLQNALASPIWSMSSHSIIYVLSGDAQVYVVANNGEAVLNEQVNKGDIFVVPQFFASMARAGQNGLEWVAFHTNKSPTKNSIAGYTSVFRAMPLEVITNAYDVSPSQAHGLKYNRETESVLFSPLNMY